MMLMVTTSPSPVCTPPHSRFHLPHPPTSKELLAQICCLADSFSHPTFLQIDLASRSLCDTVSRPLSFWLYLSVLGSSVQGWRPPCSFGHPFRESSGLSVFPPHPLVGLLCSCFSCHFASPNVDRVSRVFTSTPASLPWCVFPAWQPYLNEKTPFGLLAFFYGESSGPFAFPHSPSSWVSFVGPEVEDDLGIMLGVLSILCCLLDGGAKGGVFWYVGFLPIETLVG